MGSVADTNDTRRMIQQEVALAIKNVSSGNDEEKIKRLIQQELNNLQKEQPHKDASKEASKEKPIDFVDGNIFYVCVNGEAKRFRFLSIPISDEE